MPCLPNYILLNDDYSLALSKKNKQKKTLFCGITAAKEMVVNEKEISA